MRSTVFSCSFFDLWSKVEPCPLVYVKWGLIEYTCSGTTAGSESKTCSISPGFGKRAPIKSLLFLKFFLKIKNDTNRR